MSIKLPTKNEIVENLVLNGYATHFYTILSYHLVPNYQTNRFEKVRKKTTTGYRNKDILISHNWETCFKPIGFSHYNFINYFC